ncbi:MAG: hypothetical protein KGI46_01840 [Alphaproteobacteria bacterium]|nr:hypothetical protein [Alphaproteobacteria bacterium]MDE1932146.1 hypothetical protein [Alphaproteobacteria bacterium]
MRLAFAALAAGLILAPALAQAQAQSQITCAQLPKAAEFVNTKLQPGPNTDAAKRHLEAAQHATSDAQCVAELRKVDYYAKRSMAGDKRAAAKAQSAPPPAQGQAQPQAPAQGQAQSPISCAQLPQAADFVNTKLKPGPNTDAAKQHLAAAQNATSDKQCTAELRQVDYYAKRSLAADQHAARHVKCGDMLHPTRPGGVDYHGPPVPGCLPVRLW